MFSIDSTDCAAIIDRHAFASHYLVIVIVLRRHRRSRSDSSDFVLIHRLTGGSDDS